MLPKVLLFFVFAIDFYLFLESPGPWEINIIYLPQARLYSSHPQMIAHSLLECLQRWKHLWLIVTMDHLLGKFFLMSNLTSFCCGLVQKNRRSWVQNLYFSEFIRRVLLYSFPPQGGINIDVDIRVYDARVSETISPLSLQCFREMKEREQKPFRTHFKAVRMLIVLVPWGWIYFLKAVEAVLNLFFHCLFLGAFWPI